MSQQDSSSSNNNPYVEVILSRSSYRVGESVVGTVRLVPPSITVPIPNTTTLPPPPSSPRDIFSDTYLFVAGWCRLDPRWHNTGQITEYAKTFQSPGVHHNLQNRKDSSANVIIDENCVCFWTTNVLTLMDLQERQIGRWEDVKPKPIGGIIGGANEGEENNNNNVHSMPDSNNTINGHHDDDDDKNPKTIHQQQQQQHYQQQTLPLEKQQLAFTFRADLPMNLPHSVQVNSCRYFYAVMVGTRVKLPGSSRRKQWLRHGSPLHILSLRPDQPAPPAPAPPSQPSPSSSPTIYPFGSCTAMAHSTGLPCHVSATELHQPTGQILVNRSGLRTFGSGSNNAVQNNHHNNIQTMRITDLKGIPCCVLTVMGVVTSSPGSRMVLKFDFPKKRRNNNNKRKRRKGQRKRGGGQDDEEQQQQQSTSWTPCYQVSASLEGEELSYNLSGTKKRSQAYQFDTAHSYIDPECTERVCLSLLVPLEAPTTIQTDIVQVTVKCIIDITVGGSGSTTTNNTTASQQQQQQISYSNLRLELPCRIVHSLSEYEVVLSGAEDPLLELDDTHLKLPLDELILGPSYRSAGLGDEYYSDDPPLIETVALRNTQDTRHPSSFVTKDIQQDLKILSLRMANDCNLVDRSE